MHVPLAEIGEQGHERHALVLGFEHEDVCAGVPPRLPASSRSELRGRDDGRRRIVEEPTGRVDSAARVDQDARRRTAAVLRVSNRERRIVHERGPGADHDRVRRRSEPMDVGASRFTGDPA